MLNTVEETRMEIFIVDDIEWIKREYRDKCNTDGYNIDDAVKDMESFKVIIILYGTDTMVNRVSIFDYSGGRTSVNDLNAYQKSCILESCHKYFCGKDKGNRDILEGVINVVELTLNQAYEMIKDSPYCAGGLQ